MKKLKYMSIILIVMTALPFAFGKTARALELSRTSKGIKAVLKVEPENGMIDLYLYDTSKHLQPITQAKVLAKITLPDGKKAGKELVGMAMGEVFSFMNTLDMSQKGRYILDIHFEAGVRKAEFKFVFDLK